LAEQPLLGRSREELVPDLRSFPLGRYVIFYEVIPGGIAIVRPNCGVWPRLLGLLAARVKCLTIPLPQSTGSILRTQRFAAMRRCDLLDTAIGAESVLDTLGRIEHGVFA
jgi:hypothetical protein